MSTAETADGVRLELVSHALCPYVQRAVIALEEKGVPYTRTVIDLSNRPDWFNAISPLGKVPLLIVRQGATTTVLFESSVIVEYLEDTHGPALHPADPLVRAQHRAWMEFGSAILADLWTFYTAPDESGFATKATAIDAKFTQLETTLGGAGHTGPFFAGARFSLVDAVFGPIVRYWQVLDELAELDVFRDRPHVARWRDALLARPSVHRAVAHDYALRLSEFIRSRGGIAGRRLDALATG